MAEEYGTWRRVKLHQFRPETIYFHACCRDGLFAAYLCSKDSCNVKFKPIVVGTKYDIDEENITFLDMCPAGEMVDKLIADDKQRCIRIIDHHVTNKQNMDKLVARFGERCTVHYSANAMCATMLVYNMLSDSLHNKERALLFANYVDDRDRWNFVHPHSKEVDEYLSSVIKLPCHLGDVTECFASIDAIYNNPEVTVEFMANEGSKLLTAKQEIVELKANLSGKYVFHLEGKDYRVRCVDTRLFRSEIGAEIVTKFADEVDFAICYHFEDNDCWLSMRSNDTHIDISEICKKLGGGGHRNAAGCSILRSEFGKYFTQIH